jgi:Cu/Ag efflux protein CusF
MRVWRVVVLVNLALAIGVGWGWVWWGREARRLAADLEAARVAASQPGGEREFQGVGVVRAPLPDLNLLVITHQDIPGFMPAMTMGFRATSPKILESVKPGDEVRFTLRGTPPSNMAITAIAKTAP